MGATLLRAVHRNFWRTVLFLCHFDSKNMLNRQNALHFGGLTYKHCLIYFLVSIISCATFPGTTS